LKLKDAIADYLAYIVHEAGLSKSTHKSYQFWLNNLHRWMVENGYPEPTIDDYTPALLRRYLYSLSGRNLRPRTIRGAFHPIKGLAAHLVRAGAIPADVSKGVMLPKKDAAVRLTVSDEEIELLLDATQKQRDLKRRAFDLALLSVLVYGGLRRQELIDLEIGDINLAEGSILVRAGKGSKSRKVFIHEEATEALREWMALRPVGARHNYLFALDTNRRIAHEGLRLRLEDIKARAGLAGAPNIKPHSLRHAAATRLLRNGANLRDIQAFLGHSSLVVTSVYLHSDEEQLKGIAHMGSPRTPTRPTNTTPSRFKREDRRTS
jgi:site-specific recombinase XerD